MGTREGAGNFRSASGEFVTGRVQIDSDGNEITNTLLGAVQYVRTGTSGVLIAANPKRKALRWMNVGAADVTVAPGTNPPTVGQGLVYGAGSAAGKQGGSDSFDGPNCPTNAFSFSAAAAAIIAVWEIS